VCQTEEFVDSTMLEKLEVMISDVGVYLFAETIYENMFHNAKIPLYPSPTNFTRLLGLLRLMNSKAINEMIDKSLT